MPAQVLSIDVEEGVFAEVLLNIGGPHLRARVTRAAVDDLNLIKGQKVYALIKSVVFEGQLLAKQTTQHEDC